MVRIHSLLLLAGLVSSAPAMVAPDADVIVIGAGFSGMAAAVDLIRANLSVLVLEANARTGGRVRAYEFGDPSVKRMVLENGANWIAGVVPNSSHFGSNVNPLWRMAGEVGLSVVLDAADSAANSSAADDMMVLTADGQPADLGGARRKAASDAWDCANRTAVARFHSGPDEPLAEVLARCGWTPEGGVDDVIDWDVTVDPQGPGQSLLGALPVPTYMWWGSGDYMCVDQNPRGLATLVDHFSKDVLPAGDPRLLFLTMVESISTDKCGSVTVHAMDGRNFSARHVVSTLPLGVLRAKHRQLFHPPLPERQVHALETASIVMTNYSKDHNNRSPPLTFRTYQILPHTNSYFHCLYSCLDLLQ